jgi:hypothetical protein
MKAIQLFFELVILGGIISVLGTCIGPAIIFGALGIGACEANKGKVTKTISSLITHPSESPPRAIIIAE